MAERSSTWRHTLPSEHGGSAGIQTNDRRAAVLDSRIDVLESRLADLSDQLPEVLVDHRSAMIRRTLTTAAVASAATAAASILAAGHGAVSWAAAPPHRLFVDVTGRRNSLGRQLVEVAPWGMAEKTGAA